MGRSRQERRGGNPRDQSQHLTIADGKTGDKAAGAIAKVPAVSIVPEVALFEINDPVQGSTVQELDGFFDHDLNAWNNWNCWNLGLRCAHIMTNRYPSSSANIAPYWIGRRTSA